MSRVCLQRNSKQTSRLRCDAPCSPACDTVVSVLLSPAPFTSPGAHFGTTVHKRSLLKGCPVFPPSWLVNQGLISNDYLPSSADMNAAVRAVVRMGIYVGAKVYFIYEVSVTSLPAFSAGLMPARGCRPQARGDGHTGYQQGSPGTRRACWGCWGHTLQSRCTSVRFVLGSRASNK